MNLEVHQISALDLEKEHKELFIQVEQRTAALNQLEAYKSLCGDKSNFVCANIGAMSYFLQVDMF